MPFFDATLGGFIGNKCVPPYSLATRGGAVGLDIRGQCRNRRRDIIHGVKLVVLTVSEFGQE